jgi:oxygen-independent coproporphyrinogen-3 oxidase
MNSGIRSHFEADLIRAYDVNGPRYTSYPTANLFAEDLPEGALDSAIAQLPANAPLSLYLHVPFCATVCYYCACNKIITNNRKHAITYLARLYREMAMIPGLPADHCVEQLHFGGGTPTYLTNEQFIEVFEHLKQTFNLLDTDERDFSIEIDPRTVDPARVAFLTGLGINRMSLGIQDFDPDVQLAVNRLQSESDTAAIIEAARNNGVKSLSVDLIYGLPQQNLARFSRTLDRIINLSPDRISLYSYAHLPARFKTQRQIKEEQLPNAETKLMLLQLAVETLTDAGYVHVGMDHFAKPDDELVLAQQHGGLHRNFQGYTTHGHCDLIGLGISAISSIGNLYCQNVKTLDEYVEAIDNDQHPVERGLQLSADDKMVRALIGTLMCHYELDIRAFEKAWGVDLKASFPDAWPRLESLAADNLLELPEDGEAQPKLRVTPEGRYLIRNVAMTFDRYLPQQTSGFSKAI